MSNKRKNLFYAAFAVVIAGVFAAVTFRYTTRNAIQKDAAQNTRAAYHLVHTGVISLDNRRAKSPARRCDANPCRSSPPRDFSWCIPPSPSPIHSRAAERTPDKTVKGVNAFWRFLVAIFLFLLCLELFPDRACRSRMALICLIASEFFFLSRPGIVDRMYTELPETALMLLASWSAVRFVRGKTKARALWLGVALGLLALCKTAFLLYRIGFIVCCSSLDRADTSGHRRESRHGDISC